VRTARTPRPAGRRRRPKALTEAPTLLAGPGGQGLAAGPRRRAAGNRPPGATAFTEDPARLDDAEADGRTPDPGARAAARAIAARMALRPPARRRRRAGAGDILSVPYSGDAVEVDLDRTLEALGERRLLQPEDVIVRERRRRRRAVVLAVDVSGSMRGGRIRTAAAAVGALSAALARDDFAVLAFWSDAAMLLRFGEHATLEQLVDELIAIPPSGLTNVAFPLEMAARELQERPSASARVLLLSDCVHNAGPDPRAVAARLGRLDVLLDASGEQDPALARDLARAGCGMVAPVHGFADIAPALERLFGF
jgi:Mg-chelatase subunit ChlD